MILFPFFIFKALKSTRIKSELYKVDSTLLKKRKKKFKNESYYSITEFFSPQKYVQVFITLFLISCVHMHTRSHTHTKQLPRKTCLKPKLLQHFSNDSTHGAFASIKLKLRQQLTTNTIQHLEPAQPSRHRSHQHTTTSNCLHTYSFPLCPLPVLQKKSSNFFSCST